MKIQKTEGIRNKMKNINQVYRSAIMVIRNLFALMVFAISVQSCNRSVLEQALDKASTNRQELEKVLEHYKNDELKLKAARFLIENMDAHSCLHHDYYDSFYRDIDSLYRNHAGRGTAYYRQSYETLSQKYNRFMFEAEQKNDIECLSADYLIAHIDSAFQMRQSPWVGEYSFEHFCNYVLPYRICEEPISDWVNVYRKEYTKLLESYINEQQNKFQFLGAFNILNRKQYASLHYSSGYMPEFPLSLLPSVKIGDCYIYAKHCVAQMRALGIPSALDFVPQWGNRSMGHAWPVFFSTDDTFFPYGVNEPIGDYFFRCPNEKMPKVFRMTYAKQPEMLPICENDEPKPELFQTPCMQDVTHFYVETSDVNVSLFPNLKSEYVYLATFDNWDWQIVHFAERDGNKALFRKMGRGIVYLPVIYGHQGGLIPAGHPFVLNLDGSVHVLQADCTKKGTVRLVRKYRDSHTLMKYCKEIKGGKFQVANRKDFSDSITIAVIGDVTESRFHTLASSNLGKYRYFRYLATPNSNYNMAEVEVYDESGNRILIEKSFDAIGSDVTKKLFDGDVLTYYASYTAKDASIWAAIEFVTPKCVSKVRFLPRNDDNFIREGETYQLYYWIDGGWKLIEETKGNHEGILYIDNVPTNALLLLHNATRGMEERIFTYENGKQVWW